METFGTRPNQIDHISIRQSPGWMAYLASLGWTSISLDEEIYLAFYKSFMGVLCKMQKPSALTKEKLDEIEQICKKKKALFLKIEPSYKQDLAILENAEFKTSNIPMSPPATLIIDLTKTEKELWQDVSTSGKYSVHRAQREGCKVEVYKNPSVEKLKIFQEISLETGKRFHFYVAPFKELLSKTEAFKDRCYLLEVTDKSGALVSAKLFITHKDCATYIQGGTSLIGRKQKGGYELMWRSILYFKNLGFSYIDLEGMDDPRFPGFTKDWGGFSHFKEKFGGYRLEFPFPYIKFYNPLLKFLSKYYRIYL